MLKCKRFIALALVLALSCFSGTSIFADDDLPTYQPGDFVCFNAITGEVSIVNANDYPALSTSTPSNMPPTFQLFNVFGSDDRTVVEDMSISPYNAIAYLQVIHPNGVDMSRGTATPFAPNAFITSAHILAPFTLNPTFRSYNLYFEYDGEDYDYYRSYCFPDGEQVFGDNGFGIEFIFVPHDFLLTPTAANKDSDYAIVVTTENVFPNYMGFSQTSYTNQNVTLCGFPTETSSTPSGDSEHRPYESTGQITGVTADLLYYLIDATDGQSGAPVYNSSNQILGIHSGSDLISGSYTNIACRVDASLYSMMLAIRNGDLNL
jgi:V8-like Glu-specific endopeptidase